LLVPPLLLDFFGNVIRCVVLLPSAVRDPAVRLELRNEHRKYWKQALGVSVLAPLGYILVLYATRLSSVSRVAPARELSMMVGAYLGARVLGEQDVKRRVVASGLIVVGVLALAFG
jgi:drug/metabolite transporter (DMT)-like permease